MLRANTEINRRENPEQNIFVVTIIIGKMTHYLSDPHLDLENIVSMHISTCNSLSLEESKAGEHIFSLTFLLRTEVMLADISYLLDLVIQDFLGLSCALLVYSSLSMVQHKAYALLMSYLNLGSYMYHKFLIKIADF